MNTRSTQIANPQQQHERAYQYVDTDGTSVRRTISDAPANAHYMGQRLHRMWDISVRNEESMIYAHQHAADLSARLFYGGLAPCFNGCVRSLRELNLDSQERTCFLKCVLRRESSKLDMFNYFDTKLYNERVYGLQAKIQFD